MSAPQNINNHNNPAHYGQLSAQKMDISQMARFMAKQAQLMALKNRQSNNVQQQSINNKMKKLSAKILNKKS